MTKQEFVDRVAQKANLSRRDAADAVDAVLDSITDVLKGGGEVNFTGFGKFSTQHREERQGVNPRNPSREGHDPGRDGPEVLGRQHAEAGRQDRRRRWRRSSRPSSRRFARGPPRAALARFLAAPRASLRASGRRAGSRDRALPRPPRRGGRAEALPAARRARPAPRPAPGRARAATHTSHARRPPMPAAASAAGSSMRSRRTSSA